jgi:hypothetical protein
MQPALLLTCLLSLSQTPLQGGQEVAARIDQFTAAHWKEQGLTPAALTTDAEFLRRVTLDLIGRVPTAGEQAAFAANGVADKRARAVARLMDGPEFAHHFGTVLDEIIQGKFAGDGAFVDYLRRAVEERRGWDAVFREVMLGPWEGDRKPAETFLRKRIRSIDDLTTDTTVAFFGVNISCAKCHDHPLVQDWKQRHYYGMASFLHRTTEGKNKQLSEKTGGDVQFVDTKGGRHTAPIMFLTGTVIDPAAKPPEKQPPTDKKPAEKLESPEKKPEPGKTAAGEKEKKEADKKDAEKEDTAKKVPEKKPTEKPASATPFSPRQALVEVALQERAFFSRAIVNRLWAYFLGRGLVHPVDQMHSENPPSIPGVLEWLGDDLAAHQYDLRRLVAGMVQSRAYQLSSRWPNAAPPDERHFARAALRPLSPLQYATSLVLVSGDERLDRAADAESRRKARLELDGRARGLTKFLDAPAADFQSSVGEALYLSNHPAVQELTRPGGGNLVERLLAVPSSRELIAAGVRGVHGREPRAEELDYLAKWFDAQPSRERAARDLVWSLLTSAEFRFNH